MVIAQGEEDSAGRCRIFIRPNCSLSWRDTVRVFTVIAIVSVSIAVMFAWLGLWLVVPFTGLELMALGGVLYYCALRGQRLEVIQFDSDEGQVQHSDGRRVTFQRYWARAHLLPPRHRHDNSRLLIGSHGRTVEVGACLNETERKELATRLRRLLAGD